MATMLAADARRHMSDALLNFAAPGYSAAEASNPARSSRRLTPSLR